jgi:hypothetical protein
MISALPFRYVKHTLAVPVAVGDVETTFISDTGACPPLSLWPPSPSACLPSARVGPPPSAPRCLPRAGRVRDSVAGAAPARTG